METRTALPQNAAEALSNLPDTEHNRRQDIDNVIKWVSVSFTTENPEKSLARLKAAEATLKTLSETSEMPGDDRLRLAWLHYWLGRTHIVRNEMRHAIRYCQQVLVVAQGLADAELLAIPAGIIGRGLS